ncbi:hypothetical protein GCM10010246_58920 [Streptomyces cuspidosporus]|uniref:DUF2630 family protein n=1 Tax=Streptomyces cuspidosporus TaxID=66882 RepID=A0ABN3GTE2_9ACTN
METGGGFVEDDAEVVGGAGTILGRITEMINQEKDLRDRLAQDSIDQSAEHARLARLEAELDRCWDLLRQRRARVAAGQDPEDARVFPSSRPSRVRRLAIGPTAASRRPASRPQPTQPAPPGQPRRTVDLGCLSPDPTGRLSRHSRTSPACARGSSQPSIPGGPQR